jgi:hypothetical protein
MPSARWLIAGFLVGVALLVSGVFLVDMRAPTDQPVPMPVFISGVDAMPRQPLGPRTHPVLGLSLIAGGLVLVAGSSVGLRREIRS